MTGSGVGKHCGGAARTAEAEIIVVVTGSVIADCVTKWTVLHGRRTAGSTKATIADQVLVITIGVIAGRGTGGGGQVFQEAAVFAPATGVVIVHALLCIAGRIAYVVG